MLALVIALILLMYASIAALIPCQRNGWGKQGGKGTTLA